MAVAYLLLLSNIHPAKDDLWIPALPTVCSV
ncbi:hypothetical protein SS1G_08763 [Sclerotinia sclerotiorum 1980 UF-70]|uniref:Uncharacterized protein n=1 Tax=Sclerotinia sclerotiorum (strain ATCC 18683 / 1980 / Ss-1) TaxID=665079 RepID=A7ETV6_SCLS1|nr:hypothetical protein SS1G_08763 [Sclerotinia sclerotiorum 1980 UF-70]EDN92898.1 hypothetical protein SS1G_08763 [Sclerotinia sclerotiorum 1980 UF-70]